MKLRLVLAVVFLSGLSNGLLAEDGNVISLPNPLPAQPQPQVAVPLSGPRKVTVDLEVPVLNGDALAARDHSQNQAFEKALDQALPKDIHSDTRSQRIKSAIRYVKSFRVIDEHRIGDSLKISYEVEIQESAFAPDPKAPVAPLPSMTQATGEQVALEIVFVSPLNAAETVDQIETQLKIPVLSFRLTRSAILLRVKAIKSPEEIRSDIQVFVGSRGKVNLSALNLAPVTPPAVSEATPAAPSSSPGILWLPLAPRGQEAPNAIGTP